MCSSGDSTAKAAENQSMQFQSQLMATFNKQFAAQSDILNFLKGTLEPQITNPQGYGADALAAMRTSATENISGQYDNAQKSLQNQQFALGGRDLPSGVAEMQMGALKQGQASDTSAAQNNITLNDANLKNSNYWNSVNALNGVAAEQNPLGYAGASTSAGNSVANLSQAFQASKQSQLMGVLGGAVGGAASALTTYGLHK
jgi:hypothetical protein